MKNSYKATIIEHSHILHGLTLQFGKIYYHDSSRVWCIVSTFVDSVVKSNNIGSFKYWEKGLWIQYVKNKIPTNQKLAVYKKLDNLSQNVLTSDFPLGECIFVGDRAVACFMSDESDYLFVYDMHTNEAVTLDGWFVPMADESNIVARYENMSIIGFDFKLKEKWRRTFGIKCYSEEKREPQFSNNLVVLNIGVEKETRRNFEIAAFKKDNGEQVWKTILDMEPDSSTVVGDKVYITMRTQMIVLDAKTGKILVDEPHGFKGIADHSVYPFTNSLVAFSEPDQKLRIFTKDGKTLTQELAVPEPYTPLAKSQPIVLDGKMYQTLVSSSSTLKPACGGILILSEAEKDEAPEIKVEARPNHSIITTENDKGEHELVITMSHENLDDILRFGEIIIKQTAYLKGYHMFPANTRDKKFNGKIHFSVDATQISIEAHSPIKEMVQEVEDYLQEMQVYSGSGENDMEIDVSFD